MRGDETLERIGSLCCRMPTQRVVAAGGIEGVQTASRTRHGLMRSSRRERLGVDRRFAAAPTDREKGPSPRMPRFSGLRATSGIENSDRPPLRHG